MPFGPPKYMPGQIQSQSLGMPKKEDEFTQLMTMLNQQAGGIKAPKDRGMFGRFMGILGGDAYGSEKMGWVERLGRGAEGMNAVRDQQREEARLQQVKDQLGQMPGVTDQQRALLGMGIGADQLAERAFAAPQAQEEYGFQNIPGVGLVKTDPRTGQVEMAYELPEDAKTSTDNVQSVQILQNGEIAYITRSGQLQRTGEFARNPYQITNIGEVPYAVDRITGGASAISTPEAVGGSKATVNTVVANEEARRAAQQELPNVVSTANRSINTLTQLRDHPALQYRYGLASVGGARPVIPGTPEAEVQALINQAGGQAFLQAFESLKGGGQITQIEGQRATDAITRLSNQNLSPQDAKQAINELIAIAESAKKRAEAQSGNTYEAPPAQTGNRLKYNPKTGEFE